MLKSGLSSQSPIAPSVWLEREVGVVGIVEGGEEDAFDGAGELELEVSSDPWVAADLSDAFESSVVMWRCAV
jgi:hypothetical protein